MRKVSGFETARGLFYKIRSDEFLKVFFSEKDAPAEFDMRELPGFHVSIKCHPGDMQKVEDLGDRQKLDIHQNPSLSEATPR